LLVYAGAPEFFRIAASGLGGNAFSNHLVNQEEISSSEKYKHR